MSKKILIVEDDISIRELLVEAFESEDYEVTYGTNGVEGLQALESSVPDLILMDMMMPVMDGYKFREELLKNPMWNSIPVVAMSAQDQCEENLKNSKIATFISKPLELDHLLETVKSFS